ncbi:Peptidoglycan-N-acetylmuramic acid deacetylase PdaA [bioreactor metagenome]|uniref:Peptidoglycan-N-acetylmuramic acid deacetylase PdaA n=1 Tax=bioreactor metagenome TaxID=1076179 RepID=A0A644XSZ0_9ZZZZ
MIKRKIAAVLAVVILAGAAAGGLRIWRDQKALATAAAITDWGVSYQKQGGTPVGNASAEYLRQFDSWYCGPEEDKVIYLTFDAGYENGYMPTILDVLAAHDAPAAFFLVGNYIKTSPDLVRRMVADGHIVGNHTSTHPDMSRITDLDTFKAELEKLETDFSAATGTELPKYYRPPQGKFSESNLKNAKQLGYKTIFWSVAYVDWYVDNQPTKEQAFDKLIPRTHPGAIVLLHSTSKTNSEILDELLTYWEEQGYRFGSLDELTGKGNGTEPSGNTAGTSVDETENP